jgi:hypothetical protein
VLIAVAVFGIVRLRQNTARLQRQAAELRQRSHAREELREENRRLQSLSAHVARNDADSVRAIHADLIQARRELAELEQRAREVRAKAAERSAAMDANRDPEKALTRLEHFQNLGRGTPGMAVQTLVWAAIKGEDAVLVDALAVTGAEREKAEAFLARLPEASRVKYPTPESLAALAVMGEILRGGALQIVGHTMVDPLHATVRVRTSDEGKEAKLPMRLGPGGWQMVVPEGAITAIERQMSELPSKPTAKN